MSEERATLREFYAIADLHLPGGMNKTMEVFGEAWDHHFDKIREDWMQRVREEDVVLIPGDISWAMTMDQVHDDLLAIGALPGKKLLLRGNHDYWWSSIGRVRSVLPKGTYAVQHSCEDCGTFVVCGTRGWMFPGSEEEWTARDEKIYQREKLRLEMALKDAARMAEERPIVCMTHYPPLNREYTETGFTALMEKYHVHTAVYGHLHGNGIRSAFVGEKGGVSYYLTSCDSLGFRLAQIPLEKKTKDFFSADCKKNVAKKEK